jgi:hypothetical protein
MDKNFPFVGSVSGTGVLARGAVVAEMTQARFERAMASKQVNA